MKIDEIVTMLRNCASIDGSGCDGCDDAALDNGALNCADNLMILAADLIENQQREIESLRQANSALRERQKWIPVAERLPEDEKPVLVFVGYAEPLIGFMTVSTYFAFDPNPHWQWDGLVKDRDQKTLFWMPLPKAPEVE